MDLFDDSDKRDFFRRQRRNLIAASLITIFYEAAGLKFPEINLLGNKVEIQNPEVVSSTIAIAFVYFLWRYYTACREISGVSKFFGACRSWALDRAREYVTRKYVNPNSDQYEGAEIIIGGRFELTFRFRLKDHSGPNENVVVRERYWIYQLVSPVPTAIQTSNFSEYVLPYLFAFIASLELFGFGIVEYILEIALQF